MEAMKKRLKKAAEPKSTIADQSASVKEHKTKKPQIRAKTQHALLRVETAYKWNPYLFVVFLKKKRGKWSQNYREEKEKVG